MADILIIGAGPAGMMAAITAARRDKQVTLVNSAIKAGKKIYATGNGRCNFTNMNIRTDCFRGTSPEFAYDALKKFNNDALINFFEELGVPCKDINGYIYPNSEQASSIAEALLSELLRLKVKIINEEKIADIKRNADGFCCLGKNNVYNADKVIVCCGGLASPSHGSDGSINKTLEKTGHSIIPQLPALVNLKFKDKSLSKLQGVRTKCRACLYINDLPAYEENGEIIFNKDNISGIPIMQLSRYASEALYRKCKVSLKLDFFEQYSFEELREKISTVIYGNFAGKKSIYQILCGYLNNKLLDFLLRLSNINPEKSAASLKPGELNAMIRAFKGLELTICGTGDFSQAQATAGGIPVSELKETMESKIISGLYFAGEIIDIDGTCGGYNLQWAFTSGYIAGCNV